MFQPDIEQFREKNLNADIELSSEIFGIKFENIDLHFCFEWNSRKRGGCWFEGLGMREKTIMCGMMRMICRMPFVNRSK